MRLIEDLYRSRMSEQGLVSEPKFAVGTELLFSCRKISFTNSFVRFMHAYEVHLEPMELLFRRGEEGKGLLGLPGFGVWELDLLGRWG